MSEATHTQANSNALAALRQYTTIVADSGDFETIGKFHPVDATTNPSLVFESAQKPAYQALVAEQSELPAMQGLNAIDQLNLLFGRELSRVVPGRISTEVEARLSFDAAGTIAKAQALIDGYANMGVLAERILIKIPATWEGVCAAEVLEDQGVHCNMTLIFSLCQSQASFDAGATMISPYVGRVTDWYKKAWGVSELAAEEDPGVLGVRHISSYAKAHGYATKVMAASFRGTDQVLALTGLDLMTISPALLGELTEMAAVQVTRPFAREEEVEDRVHLDRARFSWTLCQDAMASDRLTDGLRRFADAQTKLEDILAA